MTTITVNTPQRVGAPLGATLAADLFLRVLGWFATVKTQRSHTLDEASRVGEAARVRRLAQEVMLDDPRFAADLFAAADRHERD
jgi:hypothetical protein